MLSDAIMGIKSFLIARPYWLRGVIIGASFVLVAFALNLAGALLYCVIDTREPIFVSEYPLMFPFIAMSYPFFSPLFHVVEKYVMHGRIVLSTNSGAVVAYSMLILSDMVALAFIGGIVGAFLGRKKKVL